jgi:SAM-dependent methyltransferase
MAKKYFCLVCGGNVRTYTIVNNSPLQQNVLYENYSDARKTKTIDALFLLCEDCIFLFNPDFKQPVYSDLYDNDQSYSLKYQEHLNHVAELIIKVLKFDSSVLEIGCGNGAILNKLYDRGYRNLKGYDPSHSRGLKFVVKDYYKPDKKQFDLLILRHTIEGIKYNTLVSIFENLSNSLKDSGKIYLEIMNAHNIVANSLTYNLYHEYSQYFSEISICGFLKKFGLIITEFKHLFNEEYLCVIAEKKKVKSTNTFNIQTLKRFKKCVIWGISGRSVHFLTKNSLDTSLIKFAVDIDPKKQGKFIPFTGQYIYSPKQCVVEQPDAVIVLNKIYIEEVKLQFDYNVAILSSDDLYN